MNNFNFTVKYDLRKMDSYKTIFYDLMVLFMFDTPHYVVHHVVRKLSK